MSIWHRVLDFVSSMKLTLVCLSAATVLVFVGTLAQVQFGTHAVQERYFQSLLVWWPAASDGFRIPVFPGGHLLGAVLLLNLLAAHLRRFRLNWRNAGLHLTHGGLIVMLAGGLFTDLFSVESQIQIAPGQTKNYSEDARLMEWVVVDQRNSEEDRVAAILPTSAGGASAPDTLGIWLVSEALETPQACSFADGSWRLEMRPMRYYKPYSITLQKFTHENYPGTDIPKNFASQITLVDPGHGVNRDVLIYMNHPLRYGGETYYQSGFGRDDRSSILQVVHNPGFIAPYIACVIISFGLLIQFGSHFVGATRRTKLLRAK